MRHKIGAVLGLLLALGATAGHAQVGVNAQPVPELPPGYVSPYINQPVGGYYYNDYYLTPPPAVPVGSAVVPVVDWGREPEYFNDGSGHYEARPSYQTDEFFSSPNQRDW